MVYRVYKNLRMDCWSILGYGRRVVDRKKSLIALNTEFTVNKSGRLRTIKEQRKNVHAFVCSERYIRFRNLDLTNWVEVTYNPYKRGYFYRVDNHKKVTKSLFAIFTKEGKVYIPA